MKRALLFSRFLFLILVFLCDPVHMQAQWYPVPMPTTDNFFAITYTDSLHGYIPVSNGAILETTNGGVNWVTVLTGNTYTLADIVFPTASTGYSVGLNGAIIKTTNAGNSWSVINSPTTNVLRGVCFLNPDTGFISGQQEDIYRTTDGGITWSLRHSGIYWLRKFSFPTPQTGYCVGDNLLIFKTTNQGLTWNQLPSSGGSNLTDVKFLTVDTGYVCGYNGYLAKSFNGGLTWQILNTGTTSNFEGLWFFNSQEGYCVGTPGIIVHTTNGGATWTQEASGSTVTLKDIYFSNPNRGFIAGFVGTLLENCLPAPGLITGPSSVCKGDTGKVYSVTAVSGATGYQWSVPTGVIITSGNNTNSITVTYTATSVSGAFTVYAFKANCYGAPSSPFQVTVNTPSYPTLTGPVAACALSTGNYYSTEAGMLNYNWTVSSGGSITSGWGTNSISVTWNSAGSQQVNVLYSNLFGCTADTPATLNVTVNPLPDSTGTISGPSPVCAGATGLVYSVSPVNNSLSYDWVLPPGFTLTAGNGTNTITVSVDSTAHNGTISVSATNQCGSGPPSPSFEVIVNAVPKGSAGPGELTCITTSYTITQATASGDSAVYWYSNGQGVLTGIATLSPTYTPAVGELGPVILTMIVYANSPCSNDTSEMILDIKPKATVNAGSSLFTCGQSPVVLSGSSASNYQSLYWTTSGSGVFDNNNILHPIYTPGISDINAGSVLLMLHATSVDPCGPDSGTVLLTIAKPVSMNAGPDTSLCQGQPLRLSEAIASGYSTVRWSTTGDGTFNDTAIINPVYTPGNNDILEGKAMLIMAAEGVSPCPGASDSVLLTINKKPVVQSGPDGSICDGMIFTVQGVTADGFSSFTWESNGLGTLTGTTTLSPVYTPAPGETGIVILLLKVFGNQACIDTMVSCQVKVNIYSIVTADAGADQSINTNTTTILHATASGGTGNYRYAWQPSSLLLNDTISDPNTVSLMKDTIFIVTITDKVTGCSATDSMKVKIITPTEILDSCIVVRNVITPNGDGKNDTWIIDCIENFPENKVEIFNRWGDLVNSYSHYDNTKQVWKGTNKHGGLLPAGTYYYILTIKDQKARTGWVLLRVGLD